MESRKASQPAGAKAQPQKKKLSAKEILADIREGMSDQDLQQKYHLTREGCENLFKQLIAKGLMTEAELQWRSKLLKSEEASKVVPAPQSPPVPTPVSPPRETDDKPPIPTEIPSTPDNESGSISSKFRDGSWIEDKKILILVLIFASPLGLYGLWKTSRFPLLTKIILAVITGIFVVLLNIFAICVWVIAGVAVLSYVLWGRLKGDKQRGIQAAGTALETIPKAREALKGAKERITQAVSPLRGQQTAVPNESKAAAIQSTRSNEPVSAEEVKKTLESLKKARRDLVGIWGDIGILGIGGIGGGAAAGTIAAFFGTTSIWGLTTAGAFLGLSIVVATPLLIIVICVIGGAALVFGVSRFIKSGATAMTNRKWTIEQLGEQVKKREEEARKAKVGKTQMVKLIECLQMLLSNQEKTGITPAECEAMIDMVKNGKMTYEVAFASVEDYLKDLKEE